jgi:hypothetical protein
MALSKNRQLFLAFSPLIVVAVAYGYALQAIAPSRLKGATIESRIYEVKPDGTLVEGGTQTSYISQTGSWRKIQKDVSGEVSQVLVADALRGGVFSVSPTEASKLALFTPKEPLSEDVFRASQQFAGEVTILGYKGFVQRLIDDGRIVKEITSVPVLGILPIREVTYLDDGSKRIIEPLSIVLGEPPTDLVHLPSGIPVREALIDPRPKRDN